MVLSLVVEAPRDVALAGSEAVHQHLVLEEGDRLEGSEVEPLDDDKDARIEAAHGTNGACSGGEGRVDFGAGGGGLCTKLRGG